MKTKEGIHAKDPVSVGEGTPGLLRGNLGPTRLHVDVKWSLVL